MRLTRRVWLRPVAQRLCNVYQLPWSPRLLHRRGVCRRVYMHQVHKCSKAIPGVSQVAFWPEFGSLVQLVRVVLRCCDCGKIRVPLTASLNIPRFLLPSKYLWEDDQPWEVPSQASPLGWHCYPYRTIGSTNQYIPWSQYPLD